MSYESGVGMDFEFDCPRTFVDLHKCYQNSIPLEYDPWFQTYHPEHDEEIEKKITNQKPSAKDQSRTNKALKSNTSQDVLKKSTVASKDDLEKEIRRFNQKRVYSQQRSRQQLPRNKSNKADEKENSASIASDLSPEEELQRINIGITGARTNAPVRSFHMPHVPKGSAPDVSLISSQAEMQFKVKELAQSNSRKPKTTTSSKSMPSSSSHGIKKLKSGKHCEEELMSLLKKHNNQFSTPTTYEPSRHSVRDVRAWENLTGKVWANLSMEDRELANAEILALKQRG